MATISKRVGFHLRFGWWSLLVFLTLGVVLEDPYSAVRQVAATALRSLAPEAELDLVALTHDPIPHAPLRPEWEALLEQRNDMPMAIPE